MILSGRTKSHHQDPYLTPVGRLIVLEVVVRDARLAFIVGITIKLARLAREVPGASKSQMCDPRCIYQLAN